MKFNLKPMDVLKDFTLIVTVITILGGVAYQAGWIIHRAGASEMIKQSVYEEALDRERADLQFQIDMATMKLQFLVTKEPRNEFDEMEVQLLRDQIAMLKERLSKLDATEVP